MKWIDDHIDGALDVLALMPGVIVIVALGNMIIAIAVTRVPKNSIEFEYLNKMVIDPILALAIIMLYLVVFLLLSGRATFISRKKRKG